MYSRKRFVLAAALLISATGLPVAADVCIGGTLFDCENICVLEFGQNGSIIVRDSQGGEVSSRANHPLCDSWVAPGPV